MIVNILIVRLNVQKNIIRLLVCGITFDWDSNCKQVKTEEKQNTQIPQVRKKDKLLSGLRPCGCVCVCVCVCVCSPFHQLSQLCLMLDMTHVWPQDI